jgi:DNA-binding transcriptional MocR family regulator
MNMGKQMSLYERFAQELEGQIRAGTFPVGGRLPALRESSVQHKLSMTTVLQAYRVLEMRGIIEARPQSGYYVKFKPKSQKVEEELPPSHADPTTVSIDDLSMQLIKDTHNRHFAQFGAAFPDPDLLPTTRLNRILAELAREGRFALDTSVYPEGADELRVQVAQRAFSYGCSIKPDEVVITAGCSEALSICLQAICAPGDLVAIESPTYFGILPALEALRLQALEIPTRPGVGLSLDALRFAVDNHPVRAAIVMTNFNNPLGSCMSDEAKRELVALLEERDIPLIEDDIYGELYFSDRRPSVAKSFEKKGGVLLCSSFSKDISPGYRIGWVAPGRYFGAIQRLKMALNNGTSVLPQMTIARYLESGGYDIHLRKIRRAYAQKVMQMSESIEANFPEGTRISEPLGGYVIWVQLPGGLDSMKLYREAIKASITIAPGYIFSPTHKFQDFVRLNAAVWSQRTEKDLARLGDIVRKLLAQR